MMGLIKFLMVVALLGVLAVVVIPKMDNFIAKGKSQITSIQLSNVQTVATSYLQSAVSTCQRLLASR